MTIWNISITVLIMVTRKEELEYLYSFKDSEIIKIITGLRRCGKSTLLEMYKDLLIQNGTPETHIIRINFESGEYFGLDTYKKMYAYINEKLQPKGMNYILLDEVQVVPEFQKAVDALFIKKNCDLYITGSNSYLLSGELATLLSGRYVEIHLLPLSFKEYVSAFPDDKNFPRLYRNYIEFSSFPYTLQLKNNKQQINDYIGGIYSTVLLKDIVARKNISDISQLENIIRFMFNNIGNIVSIKKIADTMTSDGRKISTHTVESYIDALCASYILYKVGRYDLRGKQYLKSGNKYYLADVALRSYLLGSKYIDRGFILENIVFLELLRRGYKINIGKSDEYEVDFVAQKNGLTEYFQVSESVRSEETLQRELRALESIKDHNPKILLTLDDDSITDYNGIKQVYVLDWLLSTVLV